MYFVSSNSCAVYSEPQSKAHRVKMQLRNHETTNIYRLKLNKDFRARFKNQKNIRPVVVFTEQTSMQNSVHISIHEQQMILVTFPLAIYTIAIGTQDHT